MLFFSISCATIPDNVETSKRTSNSQDIEATINAGILETLEYRQTVTAEMPTKDETPVMPLDVTPTKPKSGDISLEELIGSFAGNLEVSDNQVNVDVESLLTEILSQEEISESVVNSLADALSDQGVSLDIADSDVYEQLQGVQNQLVETPVIDDDKCSGPIVTTLPGWTQEFYAQDVNELARSNPIAARMKFHCKLFSVDGDLYDFYKWVENDMDSDTVLDILPDPTYDYDNPYGSQGSIARCFLDGAEQDADVAHFTKWKWEGYEGKPVTKVTVSGYVNIDKNSYYIDPCKIMAYWK